MSMTSGKKAFLFLSKLRPGSQRSQDNMWLSALFRGNIRDYRLRSQNQIKDGIKQG